MKGNLKSRFNQRGFGTVEWLLILIIIALLAFVGWYVIHSNNNSKKQLEKAGQASSDKSQEASSSPKSSDKTSVTKFVFKEYGVQITLPNSLKGLIYEAKTITNVDSSQGTVLYLSTDPLLKDIKACNSGSAKQISEASFGALGKIDGKYPNNPTIDDGVLLKQFDNFYISWSVPNGLPCIDDQSQNDAIVAKIKDLQNVFFENFKTATLVE